MNPCCGGPLNQPFSSGLGGLTLPVNSSGVGSAVSVLSASPSANSGSGIYTVGSVAGGTIAGNLTYVVIPPQVLMQAMYGEAHGQAQKYGSSDLSEQALGIAIRNRFWDTVWFRGSTTYQNTINTQQVNGLNTSITTWTNSDGTPTAELVNAANVFDGSSTVSVANAKCWFSPLAPDWSRIQAALSTSTTVLPSVAADPRCYGDNEQFVYKTSISPNADGRGAPAFIFSQWRNLTDPAVIQIP